MLVMPLRRLPFAVQFAMAEAKCLDPGELRSHLLSTARALEERIMAEGRTEMELMRLPGGSLETSLGPFLATADILFSAGRAFVLHVRNSFQTTLALVGDASGPERAGLCPSGPRSADHDHGGTGRTGHGPVRSNSRWP